MRIRNRFWAIAGISLAATSVCAVVEAEEASLKPDAAAPAVATGPSSVATSTDSAGQLETVVVTAERRAEKINDVPIAVTAFTATERDAIGIASIDDVARFTPSVSYQDYPNRLSIRGIGRFTNAIGSDPGVAIYYDGVYTPETGPLGQTPLFIERIEVLNGPQGTLYGQNAIGGTVNVVSKRPTADFRGEARLDYGSFDTVSPSVAFSGPITDFMRFRLAGLYEDQGKGTVPNVAGESLGRQRVWYGEGQLDFDIGSESALWLKFSTSKTVQGGLPNVLIDPYNTTTYFPPSALVPSPTYGDTSINPASGHDYLVNEDQPGGATTRSNGVTGEYTYNFSGARLKYVGGWSEYSYESLSDADFASRAAYNFAGFPIGASQISSIVQDSHSFSNELTLATTGQQFIQALGGLYQRHERSDQPISLLDPNQSQLLTPLNDTTFAPAAANSNSSYYHQYAKLKTDSYGVFGQLDFALSNTLSLTAGARYSYDHKFGQESVRDIFYEPFTLSAISPVVAACCSLDVTPPTNSRSLDDTWRSTTGRVALDYKPAPGTLLYASVSRGFKSGGFNLGTIAPVPEVGPESLVASEIGLKQIVGTSLQIDATTYFYRYRNLQVLYDVLSQGITQNVFANATRAKSYGFELQTTWAATSALKFLLTYSYLNATFTNFCCIPDVTSAAPTATQNLSGQTLPQSPKNKAALDASYTFSLPGGKLAASAIYTYIAQQYFSPFNTNEYRSPGFAQTDFRVFWAPNSYRYTVIGSVKNAFNSQGYSSLTVSDNYRVVTPYQPRLYGVELQYRF